ncbi:nucleoside triphosphate pyrophosphohydrolase family protein [Bacillus thuringiensis]|uniref:nucleoside triphosphate pyrophosphohydrolase family protein n=1 Tax=Bacillus thuringiensis TaxID=1428 RepID=UPI001596C4AB|nr:nucleoside triphosphate pyrophosphohydrolase family protein [Bacillus thuringiensis]
MTKKTDELKIGFDWEPKESKPEKLVPTKPYKQLVAYYSDHRSKTIWGIFTGMDGNIVRAHWNGSFYYDPDGHMPLDRIIAVEDIVIHEPKEQNLSAAQELSVQQESANFAHAAVQGIVNAHAEKNESEKCKAKEVNVQVMLPRFYSHEEFKAYGEEAYMRGREDEHRENPQGLKTVEEYKKYGRDCYLQGQEDTEKRMISQNTLELAKEKAYSEGINFAQQEYLKSFTFSDFDLSVRRTWKKQDFKDAVSNAALGLTGEAGEVADLIKKAVYHGRGFTPEYAIPDNGEIDTDDVKDELSDVLFYVSAMAQEFGFTLEDIAKHNREKLEKRFPEGFSTEASAQKKDRASEVKPNGEILIGYSDIHKEDTLEYVGVDKAPFSKTYFSTDYELKKTLKELRDGSRVTIEDKHKGEFTFTKVGNLMRVHFKDLKGNLDSHTCLVKVSYEEVTN